MARTAGIVVRVEPSVREKLNQIAQDNGVELATELYKVVSRIADGELDLLALAGGTAPASVDIDTRINEAIAPLAGEVAYLKKLVASLIESSDGGKIINVEAIATDAENLGDIPENGPLRLSQNERNEPIRTNHTRSTNEGVTGAKQKDLSAGLNQKELADRFGLAATSSITRQKEKESFGEYCRAKDPDGIAWRWEDCPDPKGGLFFPMEEN